MDPPSPPSPYMRSDLSWNGTLPNDGSPMLSPDIIPIDKEFLQPAYLAATYSQYINQPLRYGVKNNIYLRCASQTVPVPLPSLSLFGYQSSLIAWPDYWQTGMIGKPLQTVTAPGTTSPAWIGVNPQPFTWNPTSIPGKHYSLVSAITSQGPLATFNDWNQLVKEFLQSGSYATLDQAWLDSTTPSFSDTTTFEMRQATGDSVQIMLTMSFQNLPVGTVLSMASDNYNPKGDQLMIPSFTIKEGSPSVSQTTTIPANFKSHLTVNYTLSPSVKAVPNDASISLSVAVITRTNQGTVYTMLGTESFGFSDNIPLAHFHDIYEKRTLTGSTTQYLDFWFRDTLSSTNVLPRQDGVYSSCVDIQPYGTAVCSDPETQFLSSANFNIDYTSANGIQIQQGMPNYIYVRGQNNGPTVSGVGGTISLYYAQSNLLADPSNWAGNMIEGVDPNSGNMTYQVPFIYDSNNRGYACFVWNSPAPPASGQHYCLLAQVQTAQNPNGFPGSFTTQGGLATFIANNLNWGWRNTSFQTTSDTVQSQPNNFNTQGFANAKWNIGFMCNDIPMGSSLGASCASNIPVPPIEIPLTPVNSPGVYPNQIVVIPDANFNSIIYSTWKANGQQIPSDFNWYLTTGRIGFQGDPLFRFGRKVHNPASAIPITIYVMGGNGTQIAPSNKASKEEEKSEEKK